MSFSRVDHIVIGDAHVRADISNARFDWLGLFITDYIKNNPNTLVKIIDMGDWEDMPSLSSYDRGKLDFEGRRYADDLAAAYDARSKVVGPLQSLIQFRIDNKKKKPDNYELWSLGGNHFEGRLNRIVQDNPWLAGTLLVTDNHCDKYGFNYVPFGDTINHDGIMYTHYWKARGTNYPIGGGKTPAATILREKLCSSVTAHSHVLDRVTSVTGEGKKLFSLVAGCFLDESQEEKYAGQSNKQWWKGICLLKDVQQGFPEGGEVYIPIKTLKENYENA